MKKFFKFLFGTAAVAAAAAGAYMCYKKYVKKDEQEDFDDFEDDLDDADEDMEDTSREYVSINITTEEGAKENEGAKEAGNEPAAEE